MVYERRSRKMQAQLVRKNTKSGSHKTRRLRIAELLQDENKKTTKYYSGSSSPPVIRTQKRKTPSIQPKSLTSSSHNTSSEDSNGKSNHCQRKGLAYRKQSKANKGGRISPSTQPHAICLNHILAQPYCSISASEMFNAFPRYYSEKKNYVLDWLRKNFDRFKKPAVDNSSSSETSDTDSSTSSSSISIISSSSSSSSNSSSSISSTSTSSDETTTEEEHKHDCRAANRRRKCPYTNSSSDSTSYSS